MKTIFNNGSLKIKSACASGKLATRYPLLALLAVCSSLLAFPQDINFSQFYELPLLRNPALAGLFQGDIRATAVFRTQWNSVTVPYQTKGISTEMGFRISDLVLLGVGGQIIHDQAGDSRLQRTAITGTIAGHYQIGESSYISAGFYGGTVLSSFNNDNLRFDDQFVNGSYSPTNPTQQVFDNGAFPTERKYFDMGYGVMYSSSFENNIKYYAGFSEAHVNKPSNTFSAFNTERLNKRRMLNFGLSVPSGEYDRVVLYTDVFWQGGAQQVQGGILYKHNLTEEDPDEADFPQNVSLGALTRWGDAIIPIVRLDYNKIGIGVSYDFNTMSKLTNASGGRGGFEVTATLRTNLNIRDKFARQTQCPVF